MTNKSINPYAMKLESGGIIYDLTIHGFYAGRAQTLHEPAEESEVEFTIDRITCNSGSFCLEDLFAGDIELEAAILRQMTIDYEDSRDDLIRNEREFYKD